MKYSYKDTFEIPDFFDDPYYVRNYALVNKDKFVSQSDINKSGYHYGTFPGLRLYNIDYNILKFSHDKIQSYFNEKILTIKSHYHISPAHCSLGFPHTDFSDGKIKFSDKWGVALIYLNYDFPVEIETGTTIYNDSKEDFLKLLNCDENEYAGRVEIGYGNGLSVNNPFKIHFTKQCLDARLKLSVKKQFSFKFNKMICYSPNDLHAPDYFFGNNVEDGRLTLSFFMRFE